MTVNPSRRLAKKDLYRCPRCGSLWTVATDRGKKQWCRKCGRVFEVIHGVDRKEK